MLGHRLAQRYGLEVAALGPYGVGDGAERRGVSLLQPDVGGGFAGLWPDGCEGLYPLW